jgi:hypothetical protein
LGNSLEETLTQKAPSWAAQLLFGAILTVVGGFVFYPFFLEPVQQAQAARAWPTVPCQIQESRVGLKPGDSTSHEYFIVRYAYEFGGRRFEGDQYNLALQRCALFYTNSFKAGLPGRFPARSSSKCRVNPAHPEEAVLDTDYPQELYLAGLASGVFWLPGIFLLALPFVRSFRALLR